MVDFFLKSWTNVFNEARDAATAVSRFATDRFVEFRGQHSLIAGVAYRVEASTQQVPTAH